jgi:serine/threonine protein kinase
MNTFELAEADDYCSAPLLRFSTSFVLKESAKLVTYKGALSYSSSGVNLPQPPAMDVACLVWSKHAGTVDAKALAAEMKALRALSRRSNLVTALVSSGSLDITLPSPQGSAAEFQCIPSEHSDIGYLDRYLFNYLQAHPEGPPVHDMQAMCHQLVSAVQHCHAHQISHRDIRPSNILVAKASSLHDRLFGPGLVLKLSDFRLQSLTPVYQENALLDSMQSNPRVSADMDRFTPPEVNAHMRNTGQNYAAGSDLWSLGMVMYLIGTGGHTPFDSYSQACEISGEDELRRQLEKHGLHERLPQLHDLVERVVRPFAKRVPLGLLRAHPFLWTTSCRKRMLVEFANATTIGGKDSIDNFMAGLERFSPHYVFTSEGWAKQMSPALSALVQPAALKTQYWWSGKR